ncbi:YfbM family protein [Hymenobacter sp. UYP22]|uniref:YfbM family protein n=1 Tax=Hymenobacter sp. UYP22 TaxID=3156348 RepID=UPI0033916E61
MHRYIHAYSVNMGMRMTIRKIRKADLRELLINPDGIFDFIDNDVPQGQELDLDKAWHGLHFMLTGTAWDGDEPLAYLLTGGHDIGNEEEHDVGYGPARGLTAPEVKQFANDLNDITLETFASRYVGSRMDELELYPRGWGQELEEMRNWLVNEFNKLQSFANSAAAENACLVIYL